MGKATRRRKERREQEAQVPAELRGLSVEELLQQAEGLLDQEPQRAAVLLELAVRRDDEHAGAWTMLGAARQRQGDLEGAEEALYEAARLDPDDPDIHRVLGSLLLQQERFEDAGDVLREAIALDPAEPMQYLLLGTCWQEQGHDALAVLALREAQRLGVADDAVIHERLGSALVALDRDAEAEAELREALRLDEGSVDARVPLAAALVALGRNDEAVAVSREALRLRPDDPVLHVYVADTLISAGKLEEAAREIEGLEGRFRDAEFREDLRRLRAALTSAAGGSGESA